MTDTFTLAQHYLDIGQPQKALEVLEKQSVVQHYRYWLLQSQALYDLNQYSNSWEKAKKGLEISPENLDLLHVLAASQTSLGYYSEATETLKGTLAIFPNNPWLLAQYSFTLAKQKDFDEANRVLQQALQLSPENPYVKRVHALVSYWQGDNKTSIRVAKSILKDDPENAFGHYMLAQSLEKDGRIYIARRHFRKAVSSEPYEENFRVALEQSHYKTHLLVAPLYPIERLKIVGIAIIVAIWLLLFLLSAKFSSTWLFFIAILSLPIYIIYILIVPVLVQLFFIWRKR